MDVYKLKKLPIILLMFVYGLSSLGMSVTVHYCMSDVIGWELSGKSTSSACENCGMKKQSHKGCCHDEKKTIKTQKDQNSVGSILHVIKPPVVEISSDYFNYYLTNLSTTIWELPFSNAPPYKAKVPAYIYNCVFRI